MATSPRPGRDRALGLETGVIDEKDACTPHARGSLSSRSLREQVKLLVEENAMLEEEYAAVHEENAALTERVAALTEEATHLRDRVARIEQIEAQQAVRGRRKRHITR
jgi:uncharacterized protein (DUF3084 family)